jgi:hypothetical protein
VKNRCVGSAFGGFAVLFKVLLVLNALESWPAAHFYLDYLTPSLIKMSYSSFVLSGPKTQATSI